MGSDVVSVIRWWGALFLIGAAAYPLTRRLFSDREVWPDGGYFFSKAAGMAAVTFLVYVFGTLHLFPFTLMTVLFAVASVFLFGNLLSLGTRSGKRESHELFRAAGRIFGEEVFFLSALLFWTWIKAHEPSIHGLEKFMDFGFTKSILDSRYFPPRDMWYAGFPMNYYYFGHMGMATLTRLSGLPLTVTFNLMLASLFALTMTMSFAIGSMLQRLRSRQDAAPRRGILTFIGGVLTGFLVTLAGNMQTIYAFTRGYSGDQVKPFWQLLWPLGQFFQKLPEGLSRYWYADATRFIPYTIHEFPSYSFVVSDVHGHVLSLPFVLLAIALILTMTLGRGSREEEKQRARYRSFRDIANHLPAFVSSRMRFIFYGFLAAVLLMTNALDGPIYVGLLCIVMLAEYIVVYRSKRQSPASLLGAFLLMGGAAAASSMPFLFHFSSFVHGLAVNCPPAALANTHIGPLLFEGVEKCQHSPLWMLMLLWGFFVFCGVSLMIAAAPRSSDRPRHGSVWERIPVWFREIPPVERVLIVFFFFALLLILFPEFFYFKDIYPMHFRSNTMFKLGYQAFILFSIVSGYAIVTIMTGGRRNSPRQAGLGRAGKTVFTVFLIPQLFLVSLYPMFSVRSYFDSLRTYRGIEGMGWMREEYPDDYAAVTWLNTHATCDAARSACAHPPVLVEADGDSYTDFARFSAFTGIPAVIGWPVHEWLWRGSYDAVAPRRQDVTTIYQSPNLAVTRTLLAKYRVTYVIVGTLERRKYLPLEEWKFAALGTPVFHAGLTDVYRISGEY
ncbi:DUF2298 domain-containing protein [Patescibacteria group bacterium]|nr:DUF2298 domain-containing protein [Patescibacteria group bacterium]